MPSSAYDDIVAKTTDENLTSENWELILNLCDKVNDEGESGSRTVIAALLKRLAHRSPTVQLYSLSLAEALSKNCGEPLHRELASRSFTQGLEKLVTDRNTHEKVKRRALYLISLWTGEFESNPQLSLMEELYENLKAKDFNFEQIKEPPPPAIDEEEIRRREEEELQKVLEMSLRDKGGRGVSNWEASGPSSSSSRPGPSASSATAYTPEPARPSAYQKPETTTTKHSVQPSVTVKPTSPAKGPGSSSSSISIKSTSSINNVTRVRALHSFEPTVAGELGFEKGDIIKVTDRAYENWWRGQLKGRTGIFPVNYVEPLPDLTAEELAREAEQEATVFAQAANIDKLVSMLRGLDPSKDNLADNEEIQELYRSSMALRPKIVKLIDKYSQKRAELVAMNENFVKARAVFDQMMEESLARHTGVYESRQPSYHPESRVYGWDAGYEQPGYGGYGPSTTPYPASQPPYQSQPYPANESYGYNNRRATVYGTPMPQGPYTPNEQFQPGAQPYGPVPDAAPAGYSSQNAQQSQPPRTQPQSQPFPQSPPQQQPPQPQPQFQPQSQPQSQFPPQPTPQPQFQSQPQPHPQVQPQPKPQPVPQSQALSQPQLQPNQAQAEPQGPPQNQAPAQQPTQQQFASGPPYPFDPNAQYPDPNVQAWAQYYAQGGTDPAGAVYFISIPGVTDANAIPALQPRHRSMSGGSSGNDIAANTNGITGAYETQNQDQNNNSHNEAQHPGLGPKRQSSLQAYSATPSFDANPNANAGNGTSVYPASADGRTAQVGSGSSLPGLAQPHPYGTAVPFYTGGAPLQHATSN